MEFPSYVRSVTFEDYSVLHNLVSGAWIKVMNTYYEELLRFFSFPDSGNFKSNIPDFEQFLTHLLENGYVASSEVPGLGEKSRCNIQYAYLHICDGCNLRCKTCYYSPTSAYICMDSEVAIRAVELLAEAGARSITVSGGEPLLHPNVISILRTIKENGLKAQLVTNGILLNESLAVQLADVVDTLYVSVDGLEREHEEIRGLGTYAAAINGATGAKNAGLRRVVLTTTLTRVNIGSSIRMIRYAEKLGFEQSFSLFMPVGIGKSNAEMLLPSPQQCLNFFLQLLEDNNSISLPEPVALTSRCSCGAGTSIVSIDPDGSIFPCHLMRIGSMRIGKVQDVRGSLAKFIETSAIFSTLQENCVDSNPQCSSCEVRYFCGGGCKANTIVGGFCTDPHCTWYKPLYLAGIEFANKLSYTPDVAVLMREYLKSGGWVEDGCT